MILSVHSCPEPPHVVCSFFRSLLPACDEVDHIICCRPSWFHQLVVHNFKFTSTALHLLMLCAHLFGPYCHNDLWQTWPHYMWSTILPSFMMYSLPGLPSHSILYTYSLVFVTIRWPSHVPVGVITLLTTRLAGGHSWMTVVVFNTNSELIVESTTLYVVYHCEHFYAIIILGTCWLVTKSTTLYVIDHFNYFAILHDFFTRTLHLLMPCAHSLGACCLHDDHMLIHSILTTYMTTCDKIDYIMYSQPSHHPTQHSHSSHLSITL